MPGDLPTNWCLFGNQWASRKKSTFIVSTSNGYSCRDWPQVWSYALVIINCQVQHALNLYNCLRDYWHSVFIYQSTVYHLEITSHRYFVNYRHRIYYVQRILMKSISCVLLLVHSLVRRFFLPLYRYIRRVVAKLLRVGGTTTAGFENLACLLCVCVCAYFWLM